MYRTPIRQVDCVQFGAQSETREVHAGENEIRLAATGASLDKMTATLLASLVDAETGKPLMTGTATLDYEKPLWGGRFGMHQTIEFYYLAPGEARISIESPGHATQWFQRTLVSGEVTDLGEIRLEKECTIRGVVKGPPQGAASAIVSAQAIDESGSPGSATATVNWGQPGSPEWGDIGRFEIHGLSASTYRVGISSPYRGKTIVVNTTRPLDPIQLEVRPFAWVSVCSPRSDERLINVRIQDSEGRAVQTLIVGPTSDSHEEMCLLEYGTYNLVCDDNGSSLGTRTIRVDKDQVRVSIE